MSKVIDKDLKRREWVEAQITALQQQRAGIDRKIHEFRTFIALLNLTDGVIGNGQADEGAEESLPEVIAGVLRDAGQAMTPAQVTAVVEAKGWRPKSGKLAVRHLVGVELPRQASHGRRGIVRVEAGLYAYQGGGA